MGEPQVVEREWLVSLVLNSVRLRCRYKRRGNELLDYTVQLELWHANAWTGIVRYDNAHGFCHRDTIHADGSQEKMPIYRGDASFNFTWAIKELRLNWQSEVDRFLAEVKP